MSRSLGSTMLSELGMNLFFPRGFFLCCGIALPPGFQDMTFKGRVSVMKTPFRVSNDVHRYDSVGQADARHLEEDYDFKEKLQHSTRRLNFLACNILQKFPMNTPSSSGRFRKRPFPPPR